MPVSDRKLGPGVDYWMVDGRVYLSLRAARIARAHLSQQWVPEMERVEPDAPIRLVRFIGRTWGRGREFVELGTCA